MNIILELLAGLREVYDEMSAMEKARVKKIKARRIMRHKKGEIK